MGLEITWLYPIVHDTDHLSAIVSNLTDRIVHHFYFLSEATWCRTPETMGSGKIHKLKSLVAD